MTSSNNVNPPLVVVLPILIVGIVYDMMRAGLSGVGSS